MPIEIWVVLISVGGPLVGTFAGIMASSKLTAYRIEQLEKKVDKHNGLVDRMIVVERELQNACKDIKTNEDDIKKLCANAQIWQPKVGRPAGTQSGAQSLNKTKNKLAHEAMDEL